MRSTHSQCLGPPQFQVLFFPSCLCEFFFFNLVLVSYCLSTHVSGVKFCWFVRGAKDICLVSKKKDICLWTGGSHDPNRSKRDWIWWDCCWVLVFFIRKILFVRWDILRLTHAQKYSVSKSTLFFFFWSLLYSSLKEQRWQHRTASEANLGFRTAPSFLGTQVR